jgi:hypothetical protein
MASTPSVSDEKKSIDVVQLDGLVLLCSLLGAAFLVGHIDSFNECE